MTINIWWHTGAAFEAQAGQEHPMPVLAEPERGFTRIESEYDCTNLAVPPLAQDMVAYADSAETVRYHVVRAGGSKPAWPGKRLRADMPEPIHVPNGMVIVFSPLEE